jgi:hypothetical protein
MNIPTKFGFNWPKACREEDWNLLNVNDTNDGHQVISIAHVTLLVWSVKKRWAYFDNDVLCSLYLIDA